jgi:hypothetical protein
LSKQTDRRDAVERALIHHGVDYSPPSTDRPTFVINTTTGRKEANLAQAEWYCQALADVRKERLVGEFTEAAQVATNRFPNDYEAALRYARDLVAEEGTYE